jgi:hypothetical protein
MIRAKTMKIEDISLRTTKCLELDVAGVQSRFASRELLWFGTVVYLDREVVVGVVVSFWSPFQNKLFVVHYIVLDAFSNYGVEQTALASLSAFIRKGQTSFRGEVDFVLSPELSDFDYCNMVNLISVIDPPKANQLLSVRGDYAQKRE